MPPSFRYRFLLTAEVFELYQTLRWADRKAIKDVFRFLGDHPFSEGDYQESGEDGRPVEVLLKGCFLFTFWADHFAKEIRIVRVDRA